MHDYPITKAIIGCERFADPRLRAIRLTLGEAQDLHNERVTQEFAGQTQSSIKPLNQWLKSGKCVFSLDDTEVTVTWPARITIDD